ncbi:MAG TPA: hypothetical protein VFF28_07290 [Candidatus Nanoarchaeia archaeon]|nr:hypothetical protein [Candidatus Nanoarchaeia archaeon]
MNDGCTGPIKFAPNEQHGLHVCAVDVLNKTYGCKAYNFGEYGAGDSLETDAFQMNSSSYRLKFNWARIRDPNGRYDHGGISAQSLWQCTHDPFALRSYSNPDCSWPPGRWISGYWSSTDGSCTGTYIESKRCKNYPSTCRNYENNSIGGSDCILGDFAAQGCSGPSDTYEATNSPGDCSGDQQYYQSYYSHPTSCIDGTPSNCPANLCTFAGNTTVYTAAAAKGIVIKIEDKIKAIGYATFNNCNCTLSECCSDGCHYDPKGTACGESRLCDNGGVCISTRKQPKITKTTYSYDPYGNIIKIYHEGDVLKTGDEKTIINSYDSDANRWILNKLNQTSLLSYDNSTVRQTEYSYDAKGDLIQRKDWSDGGEDPTMRFFYDSYGNLIESIDANGHSTRYEYDATYTLVTREIDASNNSAIYTYDNLGRLTSQADPNGFTTHHVYDTFGRRVKQIRPYDTMENPTLQITYNLDGIAPEEAITRQREEYSDTIDTYQYYDGFGRIVQQKAGRGLFISQDISYDARGRQKSFSNAYYSSQGFSPASNVVGTSYLYDIMCRVILQQSPDGTKIESSYDHWSKQITDKGGIKKAFIYDAYGNIVFVKEYNDGDTYTTSYEYDTLGNLISLTDSQANKITYTYDALGRKTRTNDSDLGIWSYTYDKAGNLIVQEDNKGNAIELQYDNTNRLLSRKTVDQEIIYTYDAITKGTLSSVKSKDMIKKYWYDERLREVKEEIIIDGISFNTTFQYDSYDRLKRAVLPNGEALSYGFNEQGLVRSVDGILDNIEYNEFGQPKKRLYSNGLKTDFAYGNDLRISHIKTGDMQDYTFNYDPAGNLITLKDLIANQSDEFAYDDLERLKVANVGGKDIQYEYDLIGNMKKAIGGNRSLHFAYAERVHAPEAVIINQSCQADLVSEYSDWGNIICLSNDRMNQSRSKKTYDANYCGEVANSTTIEYRAIEACDYCTPNLLEVYSDWQNISCHPNDKMNQTRTKITYDAHFCDEVSNITIIEYRATEACDYCTPDIQTRYTQWVNLQCLPEDLLNQSRVAIAYDANYCGEAENTTTVEYQSIENCDYCIPNMIESPWSDWYNTSTCLIMDRITQARKKTLYDSNLCNEIANETSFEYMNSSCNYCTSAWSSYNTTCSEDSYRTIFTYSNSCCADTSLASDCNIPDNATYPCQYSFNISLRKGWNLVSIPLDVDKPLESIAGKFSAIWGYSGAEWSNLLSVNETIGFWINMDEESILTVVGQRVNNVSYTLFGLVGYPNLTGTDVSDLYNNPVYAYNGSWQSYIPGKEYNSLQTLKPGYGYWVLER